MPEADRAVTGTGRLAELLRETVAQLKHRAGRAGTDAVLYLGTRHHAFPTLIVTDPVLEPVDKIVWMVLCRNSTKGGRHASISGYDQIGRDANISSRTTIARSLAILRATRWLTLCAKVRNPQGRFAGNVYALHDEPLSLGEAMRLDREYFLFLDASMTHAHPRVRMVAAAVLASVDEDIRCGLDVAAPACVIERRLEAEQASASPRPRRYFSFTAAALTSLATFPPAPMEDHVQTLDMADGVQNLEAVNGSSSINKIIPTTTSALSTSEARDPSARAALHFPASLTPNQRALAVRYLDIVPASLRQAILDELEGRIRAAKHGARPLYDRVRYLHRLCREAAAGRFAPNLGSAIERERFQRHPPPNSTLPAPDPLPPPSQRKAERRPGDNPVRAIRDRFNLPTRLPHS